MYNAIIFDVDGTLFNTSEGIFNCINHILAEEDLPLLDVETLNNFIGPPVYDSFIKYCKVDEKLALNLTKKYREYYVKHYVHQSQLYDGMKNLLDALKKANSYIAIATMKTQIQIDTLLSNEKLVHYFDIVNGVKNANDTKAEMILDIAKRLNILDLNTLAMVGDTLSDAKAAHIAGVDFFGVTYGFGLKNESDLDDIPYAALCKNVNELSTMLLKRN